jgi:hypothetical protein
MSFQNKTLIWLLVGDGICALIISLIGFYTHYGKLEGFRWLTTFLPVCIAWLAIAPWLGVYQDSRYKYPAQSWRPALAAFLSAPLAAWIRGALLESAILPLFILVLGLTDALGFIIWRFLYSFFVWRKKRNG